jgi:hypothetical protein
MAERRASTWLLNWRCCSVCPASASWRARNSFRAVFLGVRQGGDQVQELVSGPAAALAALFEL